MRDSTDLHTCGYCGQLHSIDLLPNPEGGNIAECMGCEDFYNQLVIVAGQSDVPTKVVRVVEEDKPKQDILLIEHELVVDENDVEEPFTQQHVYPLNDTREHITVGTDCWCQPTVEHGVITHNSADNREAYEKGERKPH